MRRSKKKGRGNPLQGKSEPMREVTHRAGTPTKGESLGFGRDRARKYGHTPPVN